MPCYFLRDGHVAGVEMLPLGLSDDAAIARAHVLLSKRKGPLDGFEVWDRARFVPHGFAFANRKITSLWLSPGPRAAVSTASCPQPCRSARRGQAAAATRSRGFEGCRGNREAELAA
jgi:hypothetical protein